MFGATAVRQKRERERRERLARGLSVKVVKLLQGYQLSYFVFCVECCYCASTRQCRENSAREKECTFSHLVTQDTDLVKDFEMLS